MLLLLSAITVVCTQGYNVKDLVEYNPKQSLESERTQFLRHELHRKEDLNSRIIVAASENTLPVNNSSPDPSCPTWTYRADNGSCECGDMLNGAILCNITSHRLDIHVCYCMTYEESTEITVAGHSVYGCTSTEIYRSLPLNVTQLNANMCGHLHRTGQLCGQCEEGYKQPAYFYGSQCVMCNNSNSYNWLKYLAIAYIPLTVFLIIVFCFRVSATSVQLNAFVLFSQVVSTPPLVLAISTTLRKWPKTVSQIGITFYGIWNLDFLRTLFPQICLDLSSLQVLALDYAIAFYPLLLMMIFYVLIELHDSNCRPMVCIWKSINKYLVRCRRKWNVRASIVDAFATFLLLSYVKLLSVSGALLFPRPVYDTHYRRTGLFLYYDTTIRYLSAEHLPYVFVAIAILIVFILAPLLLLIFYPMRCFQRCLSRCRIRSHAIHIFVDTFQGYYKDGTGGTRDCRYFAAMYFLVRIIMFIIFISSESIIVFYWEGITVFAFSIFIIVAKPYKHRYSMYNTVNSVLTLLLAFLFMTSYAFVTTNAATSVHYFVSEVTFLGLLVLIGLLPLAYLFCITFYWLCFLRSFSKRSTYSDSLPDRMINPIRYNNSGESLHDPVVAVDKS